MKSVAGLSRLWDRGEFDRVRGGDGSDKFYGRRLAMHLMIQPVVAELVLSDDMLVRQGFLARCLMVWPSTRIGTRLYVAADIHDDQALVEYRKRITALLDQEPTERPEAPQELAPLSLRLTPEAKARWTELHDRIEAAMAAGGALQDVRAWGSKAPAQVLRTAGVLTLVEDKDARMIDEAAIGRAADIVGHTLDEALRIVGTSRVPVETKDAQALLDWSHKKGIEHLHSRAALRMGPNHIRSRSAFNTAIRELEKAGWAEPIPGGADIDGAHRQRVWRIRS